MQPELFENLAVEEPAVRVESLVCTPDRDFRPNDARAGDAEDPLQILLSPEGAELARACADDGDGQVPKNGLEPRA